MLAAVAFAAPAAEYDPKVQSSFVEAMRLVEAGEYEAAIKSLRLLLAGTASPRIKLELARALFHQGSYKEARALFNEVLLDPDTPWRVRDNIDAFVQRIDAIQGYVRFSVSVVTDSNPRNLTSQREFTIGGFRLTYTPPVDNKRVTGLRYAVQALQPIYPQANVSAYLTGSYLDYPAISLDRLTVDTGLAKGLLQGRASGRLGLEAGTFNDKRLYQFPYVAGEYVLAQSPLYRLVGGLKGGHVNFPDYGYLDADYVSASASAVRAIAGHTVLSVNGTLEHSKASEDAYSYRGLTVAPGLGVLLLRPALLVNGTVSLGTRRYMGIDPFFGAQRVDRRTTVEFQVQNKEWRWRNFTPALILSIEKNSSNIDFYEYRKVNVSLAIQ